MSSSSFQNERTEQKKRDTSNDAVNVSSGSQQRITGRSNVICQHSRGDLKCCSCKEHRRAQMANDDPIFSRSVSPTELL